MTSEHEQSHYRLVYDVDLEETDVGYCESQILSARQYQRC